MCWATGNHDVRRVVSRWGDGRVGPGFAKFVLALVATLRGSMCRYQGDELGLTEAEIPFERLRDPFGIAFWPEYRGRDGCRTPLRGKPTRRIAGF